MDKLTNFSFITIDGKTQDFHVSIVLLSCILYDIATPVVIQCMIQSCVYNLDGLFQFSSVAVYSVIPTKTFSASLITGVRQLASQLVTRNLGQYI